MAQSTIIATHILNAQFKVEENIAIVEKELKTVETESVREDYEFMLNGYNDELKQLQLAFDILSATTFEESKNVLSEA